VRRRNRCASEIMKYVAASGGCRHEGIQVRPDKALGRYRLNFLENVSYPDDSQPNETAVIGSEAMGQRESLLSAGGNRKNDDAKYVEPTSPSVSPARHRMKCRRKLSGDISGVPSRILVCQHGCIRKCHGGGRLRIFPHQAPELEGRRSQRFGRHGRWRRRTEIFLFTLFLDRGSVFHHLQGGRV